jgi:hypothetical protein
MHVSNYPTTYYYPLTTLIYRFIYDYVLFALYFICKTVSSGSANLMPKPKIVTEENFPSWVSHQTRKVERVVELALNTTATFV